MPLRAFAAVILAIGLALGCASDRERAPARPNVILIVTDDQTAESLRVMTGVRSSLAAAGTTFDRAFAASALCCPSRATLLTGQYPHNHGVIGNRPPDGGYGALDTTEWLPVWLRRAGYHTVHIGKFLNRYGQDAPPREVPPGWSEWYASVDPSTYRYRGYRLNENGAVTAKRRYSTDEYERRAVRTIARVAPSPRPFFLSVGFLAPHGGAPRDAGDPAGFVTPAPAARHRGAFAAESLPRGPAFDEADVSDKPRHGRVWPRLSGKRIAAIEQNYRQELESLLAVDEGVVSMVKALRAARELDDTLIVFTSDNGFFHGEHRVPRGKVMVYEPSVRVPLVMRGPGLPAGRRRRGLVTNADVAPTILDAASARPGRPQDGLSLVATPRDRDLLIQGPAGYDAVAFAAIRSERFTYAEHATGERELYDLRRDPHQLRSVHDRPAYAAVRARLARRLAILRRCAGASCR